jgi:hypothetical protein
MLDKEEVFAGCKVLRVGRLELVEIRVVIIHRKGSDFEVVVADDPELESVPRMTGRDTMDHDRIAVSDGDGIRRAGSCLGEVEGSCGYGKEYGTDEE